MSKPWEQEWTQDSGRYVTRGRGGGEQVSICGAEDWDDAVVDATFIAAAPDMARAGLDVVQGVLAGVAPILGPISADEMIARGQSVTVTAQQFAALVASLRKAGVPL